MNGQAIAAARRAAGLTQAELARRVGTSRETLSAYEHDRKSPTLDTVTRLLEALDHEVRLVPRPRFVSVEVPRGRPASVPTVLPRLDARRALATVTLPLHLDWSPSPRAFDLSDRHQRARAYEIILREGLPEDILAYVDGVLLCEVWPDLVLPRPIHAAWEAVFEQAGEAA
ncbi:helix-turn-helix transcriptional regulator [Actinomycetospora sp. OC33-EN08]|uniref:Helix-turn-helix transcriptional regulator n=1 Tax=Actinomycetospora aurantiaca TaxID=3129233 RepID=A0ABU8MII4_9PSEU